MPAKRSPKDIFDIDRKTGALILGSNRLDDYATKYLSAHCPEALEKPMRLPVEKILDQEGLTVVEETLSLDADVFGCCLLLDGEITVYDKVTGRSQQKKYPARTIVVDPDSEIRLSEGARRNTLIHEALHWEKDLTFFKIKERADALRSERTSPILCRTSGSRREPSGRRGRDNQISWLEWQANRLAPRVLMPRDQFKKKACEVLEDELRLPTDGIAPSCDSAVQELSDYFLVSRASAKLRLIEVGLQEELERFDDFKNVFGDVLPDNETVRLTPTEAFEFINANPSFGKWVSENNYLYVDGYFVLAEERNILSKDGALELSPSAKKRLGKCALVITSRIVKDYRHIESDLAGASVLYRRTGAEQRLLTFQADQQPVQNDVPEEACRAFVAQLFGPEDDVEFQKMLGNPTSTLCECIDYLMDKDGLKYPQQFYDRTLLHENYFGRIQKNECNNMGSDVLMAICVGLGLGLGTVKKLFDKAASAKLNEYCEPDRTRLKIVEQLPGLPITDFNLILASQGLEELGSKTRG